MSAYQVILSDDAKADLSEISYNILMVSKDKEFAHNYVSKIYEKCLSLSDFPNRGAYPADRKLRGDGYRFLTVDDYLIFYRVNENSVIIVRIINSKRDYLSYLRL
ncbi:MAG: type II toxin-antitoxin system RelE/ParE family toxin [Clostridia bacterium]|nr:type II toxin-antitoxin system RelE/ParE family toxin [Clostridia bacterium]